jgi:hypothetical protein
MNLKNIMIESLPRYECELPYSKVKKKFRPFLVREEKKLLILEETSSQAEIYDGIIEVLNSCFDNEIDFTNIPLFEVEYAFLKLRAKSVGEIINPKIICPVTNESHVVFVDLNSIDLTMKNQSEKIELMPNLNIYMKYPTIKDLVDDTGDINDLLANCITHFEDTNGKIEIKTFAKNEIIEFLESLTSVQYEKIINFFENMPTLEINVEYRTKDGEVRELTLKGIKDFFS